MRGVAVMLALLLGAVTAQAQVYPDIVRSFVANALKLCADHGGKPGVAGERLVSRLDVDADGRDDWVIDYRHYPCTGGAPDTFCRDGFCAIDVLTARAEKEWKLLLHAEVADWRLRGGDKPALLLLQRGESCGRPKEPQCTIVYTFRNRKMHGRIENAAYFKTAK